jgi:hypothetical protein
MKRKTRVFLSYAKEDLAAARRLCRSFRRAGLVVWLDKEALLGGQDWPTRIPQAIRDADYFVAVLSQAAVRRRGYFHAELRAAVAALDEHPEGKTYLIPVRLDECDPPLERLLRVQSIDLFKDWRKGVLKLLQAMGVARRATRRKSTLRLRTDGLYVAQTHGPYRYDVLRFFPSGLVVSCPSHEISSGLVQWMVAKNPVIATGKYLVRSDGTSRRVTFQTTSPPGLIDYQGWMVTGTRLLFRKHSLINGYRDIEEYCFQRLPEG